MTNRLFAYNPSGAPIIGVDTFGTLAVSSGEENYGDDYGGIKWWAGPDEDLGYIIAKVMPANNQPTAILGVSANVGFNRSSVKTEESFLDIVRIAFGQTFATGNEAKTWLNNNNYWTNWESGAPSATPTPTPTPAPTDTPTPTPTPAARSGYYVAPVLCDAVTGGTQLINAFFYVGAGQGPMCDASSGGGDNVTGLTPGTNYVYDVTNNKVREITTYSQSSTFILNGSCSTPSCGGGGGRTGYYYSATLSDAVTGGTQPTGLVFGYSSGDTMCDTSVISISANEFSGLTAGSYFIYDADENKVRAFTLYGSSIYGSMSGSCSTPSGGARAGYWYALTRPEAITGGTQVGDVTFSGGDNTLCNASSAFSFSFSSLSGNIYIYNGDTGDVRTFYGSNSSSITAMSPCLNTNTPVYYYSTTPNDCYNTQTLNNVSLTGGADFCTATGFSADNLSSLGPNTYYMRDPFTDNFRSFYAAYNGSVSFSTSCSQYSCQ